MYSFEIRTLATIGLLSVITGTGYLVLKIIDNIKPNWKNFWAFQAKRTLRIWPAYFFVLLIYFQLFPNFFFNNWLYFFTFTQNIFLDQFPYLLSWTLCLDEVLYLIIPLIVYACGRKQAVFWMVLIFTLLSKGYFLSDVNNIGIRSFMFLEYGILGVLIYYNQERSKIITLIKKYPNLFLAIGFAGIYILRKIFGLGAGPYGTTSFMFFIFIIFVSILSPQNFLQKINPAFAAVLSIMSYPVYLSQDLIIRLILNITEKLGYIDIPIAIFFILVTIVSTITSLAIMTIIEAPINRFRLRSFKFHSAT